MRCNMKIVKFWFILFICIIPIISFQYPVLEGDVDNTHLLKVKDQAKFEPLDNTMSSHPKSMIKSPAFKLKALNEAHILFMMLSIILLLNYPIIRPPFKAYYGLIKRKLYLKPIKFTSMFVGV
ncbi:hypothetical protein M3231_09925 [Neobacillus mesonae]|nr:hypothetical protein [Neobacillus mesonae]